MNAAEKYDVLVLGGGTAGKLMAWTMAKEGRRTAVVDRKYIGGSCPNVACLPSKNVIHSAKVASLVGRHREFGIETGPNRHRHGWSVRAQARDGGRHRPGSSGQISRGAEMNSSSAKAHSSAPRTNSRRIARWRRTYAHRGPRVREPRKPRDHTRHARFAGSQADDPYRGAGPAAASRPLDRPGRRLRRPGTQPGSAQTGKPRNADLARLATCLERRCRRFAGDSAAVPGRRHRRAVRHPRAPCRRPFRRTRKSSAPKRK
jgi:choline dehydrogenase-like flavoprotein